MTLDEAKAQIAPQLKTSVVFGELMFTMDQFDAILEFIYAAGELHGKQQLAAIVDRSFAQPARNVREPSLL